MQPATGDKRQLRVAIASGKGGTGKTTVAVALALSAGQPVLLLDCDVEEPNVEIFLRPLAAKLSVQETPVYLPIPVVDPVKCTGCRLCSQFCQFNALIVIKNQLTIFDELCHGCGGCSLICPEKALQETGKVIGQLKSWQSPKLSFLQGKLDVGKALSPPLIRSVKQQARLLEADPESRIQLTIIDCPPGTACPMVTALRDVDFVVLVTEPTPFGLHDLKLAVSVVRKLNLPLGLVINRADIGDERVVNYCQAEGLEILAMIPNDRRIAEAYSIGQNLLVQDSAYQRLSTRLLNRLIERAKNPVDSLDDLVPTI